MSIPPFLAAAIGLTLAAAPAAGQEPPLTTAGGEWPGYGGDAGHTRYSPLDRIDASNFGELEIAWRFRTDNLGPGPEFKLSGTPLMAGGRLFATGGTRRAGGGARPRDRRAAVDACRARGGARDRGAPPPVGPRAGPTGPTVPRERVLYVTLGFRLVALDAATGRPVPRLRRRRPDRPEGGRRRGRGPAHRPP